MQLYSFMAMARFQKIMALSSANSMYLDEAFIF